MKEPRRDDPGRTAAVLFDLDGTLLDTLRDLAEAVNDALAGLGHAPHPVEAYRRFVGAGIEHLLREALPEGHRTEAEVAKAVEAAGVNYAARWDRHTRPYEGVPELLTALREKGLPTGIVSNKPHRFTLLAVERFFPDHRFGAVLGDRPGKPRKPDPAMPLEAARILGVDPARCLLLGDSGSDLLAARAASMRAAGALWGFRGRAELVGAGAEFLLERPLGLLHHL